MTPRRFVVCLALAACESADVCRAGAPGLELGVGEDAFAEAVDGAEAPVAYGNQGGWHVWLALAATGLAEADDVVAHLVGTIDGEPAAEDFPFVSFRCDRQQARFEAAGLTLRFFSDPEDVVGRDVAVTATIVLRDGTQLEDDLRLVVVP